MPIYIARCLFLILVFGSLWACQDQRSEKTHLEKISSLAEYLWQEQDSSGAWKSSVHGLLKKGEAYTPFILYTLLEVPENIYSPEPARIEAGLDFIRGFLHKNLQGNSRVILEYPNYSAAYSLLVLKKVNQAQDQALIQALKKYLIAQQFDEDRGISPEHPAYGGWGFGESNLASGQVGHVDLSHTRRVLEALASLEEDLGEVMDKARLFLDQTQSLKGRIRVPQTRRISPEDSLSDGGFYYSPIVLGANKAGVETRNGEEFYLSYASSTCDGILARLALGESPSGTNMQAAQAWLKKHPQWAYPGGIPLDNPQEWHKTLALYHIYVRSEVYSQLNFSAAWQDSILKNLAPYQMESGAYRNPLGARNKENDPLLGSSFALEALLNSLSP